MRDEPEVESKFLKSKTNRRTENAGLAVLLSDERMHVLPVELKRTVLDAVGVTWAKPQTFDAVRTSEPSALLTAFDIDRFRDELQLVEMKTTRRAIRDATLSGFFFGVTESEYKLARALGDRYLFAFVVLNSNNIYGSEFFVLLTYDQLQERVHSSRTQYQVTMKRGAVAARAFGVWPDLPESDRGPLASGDAT